MLTTKEIDHAKPKAKTYRLFDAHGLYLEIAPNGGKYWRLKYSFLGKERRLAIGHYPDLSLVEAREKREDARKLLTQHVDPARKKQELKQAAILGEAATFESIAREWHLNSKERWSESHSNDILHRLKMDIFPAIGSLPIATIRPIQILNTLRVVEKRGAHEMARRALQYCTQIFRYAVITERVAVNPTNDLKGALRPFKKGHYAAIDASDLPNFLDALDRNDARLFLQTRHAIRLLMMTFVRTSELIASTWDEFDLEHGEWIIPAERMKKRRPHIVPLSRQAIEILREQKKLTGDWMWVFPSQVRPRQHMSNNTILKALERMGYKGRMTGHGFRALAMSAIKEKLGYRHEVVDRQLAHAPANKVDAAYDRAKFLDERRKMMQEWADYLQIIGGREKKAIYIALRHQHGT